jgi:hypothetical protein
MRSPEPPVDRRRKVFVRSDLTVPEVGHSRASGRVRVVDRIPPADTRVMFALNPSAARTFDFRPWYGVAIDEITYACQRQIERFIARQDSDVEPATVVAYCRAGLTHFLGFAALYSATVQRPLGLVDVNRTLVEGFLLHLRGSGLAVGAQRVTYYYAKAVLTALGRRGLLAIVDSGDESTFPRNSFPNSHRASNGDTPLSVPERKAVALALRTAIQPLFAAEASPPDPGLLVMALLCVALPTGRNSTPLFEMSVDCLRDHPKKGTEFLVFFKRRGHTSSKVAVRTESKTDRLVESMPTVRPGLSRLIRRVIELTRDLRAEAPTPYRDRVWIYRKTEGTPVRCLNQRDLTPAIQAFVAAYGLKDADGRPLRVTVGRLRKTFVNRVYELLDGDLVATALAAGNQPRVTDQHYLRPGPDAERNWLFMGQCLVEELLTNTLGATERTPAGRCTDPKNGEFAPKRSGEPCRSFLNCLRCRNYVVTADDLWRLFSFYWRVLNERSRIDPRRWKRHLSHIPRLIERDVIRQGIATKAFTQRQIDAARTRARKDPHPFWKSDEILATLEGFS